MNHPDLNIEDVRRHLEQEKRQLIEESETSAESRGTVVLDQTSVGRLSRMDAMQSQAMAEANERRRLAAIRLIDLALKRIDDECYGECIECGEYIAAKRLELNYATMKCIACAD